MIVNILRQEPIETDFNGLNAITLTGHGKKTYNLRRIYG
jgi:hypothetical protein